MFADSFTHMQYLKKEEVTLLTSLKRIPIALLIVFVVVLVAAPLAFAAGARSDYTPESTCALCHDTGGMGPTVVPDWSQTGHAQLGSVSDHTANAYPISRGPQCAGCHSGNYDPTKATPIAGTTTYPTNGSDGALTEPFVGCSDCHYSTLQAHSANMTGLGFGNLANPDICGQCHARYSQSVASFTTVAQGTIHTQYPVAFNPLTTSLDSVLNIAQPSSPQIGSFWPSGQSAAAHGESAVQYDEMVEGMTTWDGTTTQTIPVTHFNSLATLKETAAAAHIPGSVVVNNCSHCMSADARILAENNGGTMPAGVALSDLKYGVTCVACHDPHTGGTPSVFNPDRDAQLIMPQSQLCGSCHNAELPAGQTTESVQTTAVHHPQQEMMEGVGAIDVAQTPALHASDCVQCHMVPTGYEYNGAPGTGGNHTFQPIMPEYAATHTVMVNGVATAMPNSSCSTCHGTPSDPLALRLQPVIDQRQAWVQSMWSQISAVLDAKAALYGFANHTAARAAWDAVSASSLTVDQTNFLKACVNMEFTQADGSEGIHNFQYTQAILNTALNEATAVRGPVGSVDISMPIYGKTPTVVWGTSTTVKGTIVGNAADLVGSQVQLWAKPAGGNYNVVAQAFVIDGGFSFSVKPSTNTVYKVQFLGSDTYAPATSPEVNVNVAYKVTFNASRTSVAAGTYVRLTGKALPLVQLPAKAIIQRKTSTGWKTFRSPVINSSGAFATTFKTARATYVLRVVVKPTGTSLVTGTSRIIKIVAR